MGELVGIQSLSDLPQDCTCAVARGLMKLGFSYKVSYVFGPRVGHNCLFNGDIFLANGVKVLIVDAPNHSSGDPALVKVEVEDQGIFRLSSSFELRAADGDCFSTLDVASRMWPVIVGRSQPLSIKR